MQAGEALGPSLTTKHGGGAGVVKLKRTVPDEDLRANGHPDDWNCVACKYRNFAYRSTCRSCGTPADFQPFTAAMSPPDCAEADSSWWKWGLSGGHIDLYSWKTAAMAGMVLPAAAVGCFYLCSSGAARSPTAVGHLAAVSLAAAAAGGVIWRVSSGSSRAVGKAPAGSLPEETRAASLERWLHLPTEEGAASSVNEKKGRAASKAREKFTALSLSASAASFLGATQEKRTAELLAAAVAGNVRRLKALVDAGVNLGAVNEYGQSALFLSAQHGHPEAVQYLASVGSDVDLAAGGGARPATVAAALQRLDVLSSLRTAGADLSLTGAHGLSPMDYAAFCKHSDVVAELATSSVSGTPFCREDTALGPARNGAPPHHALRLPPYLASLNKPPKPTVTTLVDASIAHPGAGSYMVDGALSEALLCKLETLWSSLPVACKKEARGSDKIIRRSYFCDSEGWLTSSLCAALAGTPCWHVHSCIRFLHYFEPGGLLAPHLDLSKTDSAGRRSTHTLLIYLATCASGGETVLMESLEPGSRALATVKPQRGRIFVFPHECPHRAEKVVEVPKLVVRGEVY